MTDKKIEIEDASQEAQPSETESAEQKRAAARRRFLKRGAASGTILTIFHQRSYALQTKTIYVSSKDTCKSLGGPQDPPQKSVADSMHKGKTVTRYQCTLNK
jgi:hypothetical protein